MLLNLLLHKQKQLLLTHKTNAKIEIKIYKKQISYALFWIMLSTLNKRERRKIKNITFYKYQQQCRVLKLNMKFLFISD